MALCVRPLNKSVHGLQCACKTFISFRCNHGSCFCGGTTSGRQRLAWLTKDCCVQRHSPVAPAHKNFGQPSRQFREHAPATVCQERFACHPQRCFGWHTRKGVRVSRSIREDCSTIFLRQHHAATNCLQQLYNATHFNQHANGCEHSLTTI